MTPHRARSQAEENALLAEEQSPSPRDAEAGGILTIDLASIATNWRTLASVTLPVECAAVVKADAYGCSIEHVVPTLWKAGCRTFFVADLAEARRLRSVSPGGAVYVLNGIFPGTASAFGEINVRPVINSMTEVAEWDAFIATSDWRGGAALHVDTGMNRLGISIEAAVALAQRIRHPNHGINLLMSHFACAETPDHPLNSKQIHEFRDLRLLYRGVQTSLANSSGIFLGAAAHCDLVRPGAALYGVNPTPGRPSTMAPVIELTGRIVQTREVKRGESVGYGATWTAHRNSQVATVAVGYADGYSRAASVTVDKRAAEVLVGGTHCPVIGRVSMDLISIDVTEAPEGAARRGELVTLIGGDIDIDRLGTWWGTIGYEVLTNLGSRYHRIWKL